MKLKTLIILITLIFYNLAAIMSGESAPYTCAKTKPVINKKECHHCCAPTQKESSQCHNHFCKCKKLPISVTEEKHLITLEKKKFLSLLVKVQRELSQSTLLNNSSYHFQPLLFFVSPTRDKLQTVILLA